MSDLEYLQKGGVATPTRIIATGAEPIRTGNFRSSGSIITVSENGTVKSPSILPLVFGAGMALFIVYNAQKAGFGNFSFNFR
jgi:hypothetical protein